MVKYYSNKILSLLLVIIIIVSFVPTAFASASAAKQTTTELFVDSDGDTIAKAVTSTTDAKDVPAIDGYLYSSQSTETTHVYAEQHITYIIGYPNGSVGAENNMTRAEAVVVLYRLYNGKYPAFTKRMSNNTFADVDSKAWYYKELECLYNVGVIADAGNFRPNEPITRAEFATLCAKYDGLEYLDKAKFSDVKPGHWAYSYINAAAEKGWVIGYPDGTFGPDNNITRAEVMTLVNRLFNRVPDTEQIADVKNPYNDIVSTHWAYCNVIEATVKHDMVDWHGAGYNNGIYNIVIEKFVDTDGNEIAEAVTTESKPNYHPAEITGYSYLGYITVLTYVYTDGKPVPAITKTAAVSTANVGDNAKYTVTLSNGKDATAPWIDVVMTDKIPAHTSLVHGSVYLNGSHTDYSLVDGLLSVAVGNIEAGKSAVVTFELKALPTGYGMTVTNEATGNGSNGGPVSDKDDGVYIEQGKIRPYISKSPSVSTANVGQTITYKITVGNASGATYPWENATITDVIPNELSFVDGSVYLDGVSKTYSYNNGTLSVALGDIAPGKSHTLTFKCVVQESAYGTTIYNVAIGTGGNIPDIEAPDGGVKIKDGVASMSATKRVSKSTANVGDSLTYTITVSNASSATANLKNVVMSDTIPDCVTFQFGSVHVDGYSARYSYDNETRKLAVELIEIAPGQTKTITFTAVVNSSAYGKSFENTAVLSASNDGDKTATDGGVTIADGTPEGSAGAKTVSSPTAKVGDTLTYSISLRNSSTATAAWTGVEVSDVIPEYLSFISGSVEENGRATTNFAYNAGTKKLMLFADSIAVGETVTFTFKVTVQNGAQGMYIVNTAIVSSDDREDMQLPDTGVQIDAGSTAPYMSKSASVAEARPGDIYRYTVTIKNGMAATAAWKNVIMSDVLPTGVKLVSGSVTLNGQTVSYGIAGQAIEVTVGDLSPGEDAVVTFEVRVLDSAAGTTVHNVAAAKGDNGSKTATDDSVTVPAPEEISGDSTSATGTKTVDKTIVNTGDKVTYTITAVNNTEESWTAVQIYDILDTSVLTLIDDSIYINGIRFLSGSGKWTFTDRQLVANLGDIAAGKSVKLDFTVQFKNDAANSTYTNNATIKSTSHESVYVKAPEVVIIGGGDGNKTYTNSEIHYKLFIGYGDDNGNALYLWGPDDKMTLNNMCILGYRLMTDYYRSSLGNSTATVPDTITSREVQYFISHGVISATEYTAGAEATQSQIYRILNFAIGAGLSSNAATAMSRASVASLICDLTGRDKNPNTNGLPVAYFSDKGSCTGLIDEVSNSHDYTLDSNGKETWISILND